MNKREIILFGAGILVGYLIVKAITNKVVSSSVVTSLPDTSAETIPPATAGTLSGTTQIQEPEVVETAEDPKISVCKEKWIKFVETRKFTSAQQEQDTYDNFMMSCVTQS